MSLDTVRQTFEKLGREDPLYGVLTDHARRYNKWDPSEFFETGVAEVSRMLSSMEAIPLAVARGDALDFGCGVGRLTLALGAHFTRVVGVDIADSMIARAREYNTLGSRVQYMVNTTDDLSLFPAASFDFVYSSIVLQHVPPQSSTRYIREFFRILRPGGVAVFHVPSGTAYEAGSFGELRYRLRREYLRRAWKLLRGRAPYEMHYVPQAQVEAIIRDGRARLVYRRELGRENFEYYTEKSSME